MGLDLGEEEFSRLAECISMIDGVGGSIVGAWRGGAFLIYCSNQDMRGKLESALLGKEVFNQSFDVFGPCTGAKILKESKRKLVF